MQQSISNLQKQRHRKYGLKRDSLRLTSGICYGLYTAFLTLEKHKAYGWRFGWRRLERQRTP